MEHQHKHVLPYVFILDWDQTIAGNVSFQSQQFTLYNTLKKLGFKVQRTNEIPAAFYPNAKLIRPGFTQFIKGIQEFLAPAQVYFFIYTGSEKTWAYQEISWVEKTHNIKFCRPIFTRDDCSIDQSGNIRKNVATIFPRVIRTISKLSKHIYTSVEKTNILENNLMIIDNTSVYNDRLDKLLLCPDYNYTVFENLLHGIPSHARKHDGIQKLIFSFVNQGVLCPLPTESDDGMMALTKQYTWLAAKCKTLTEQNAIFKNDDFWIYLLKLIMKNNVKIYTSNMIKKLQNAIWKHYKSGLILDK